MENVENAGAVESTETVATVEAKREPRVQLAEFLTAWEGSNSVAEVAEKTGLKETSVQARASKYRGQGIPLKEMPRGGGAKLNIAEAQALLAKLRGVSTEDVAKAADAAKVKRDERKAEREAEAKGETENAEVAAQ